ncbi:hypothetical protein K437DRAFT_47308 [Tilletiaria anomala UBC 951]|uniref:Uncharacterized protein n=1 Tax=Tilletiaria anomala (strain ATCC 24038 / CBS 436.72 / UBC 951) TaxID=1037660 RepID=A0A066VEK9_TILAU|nr:uncharacterized protein K437DRAFT_47308 [Tilletiaria anomala UBC 951]KDN37025.1 hypothetical protein K437DRAFT_47308 [Tilletiaria anomala UBC 951]
MLCMNEHGGLQASAQHCYSAALSTSTKIVHTGAVPTTLSCWRPQPRQSTLYMGSLHRHLLVVKLASQLDAVKGMGEDVVWGSIHHLVPDCRPGSPSGSALRAGTGDALLDADGARPGGACRCLLVPVCSLRPGDHLLTCMAYIRTQHNPTHHLYVHAPFLLPFSPKRLVPCHAAARLSRRPHFFLLSISRPTGACQATSFRGPPPICAAAGCHRAALPMYEHTQVCTGTLPSSHPDAKPRQTRTSAQAESRKRGKGGEIAQIPASPKVRA